MTPVVLLYVILPVPLMLDLARAVVKYKLLPSATLVVDLVASLVSNALVVKYRFTLPSDTSSVDVITGTAVT